ncbi:MAG: O-antigen ligase family protein [Acidobacteriales bacterium]|nr:O-antigen ligase family protein [Terriglobales bacterium]
MIDKAAWSQRWERIALYLTFGSAVAVFFSIAVCHTLLALSVVALLVSGARLRFPPVKAPLAIFFALTVVSLLLSTDPAAGRPQIRKFFVFLVLLTVSSAIVRLSAVRGVVVAWFGAAALSAVWSLVQFAGKVGQARQAGMRFYDYYVSTRITGFMSHWMTFSGEMMVALLLLAALLFFSPKARRYWWAWTSCGALIAVALVLAFTRSMWIATAVSILYLTWFWKRWLVLAVPVVLACGLLVSPASVQTRALSMLHPNKNIDSNQHRIVCWRTGWEMIKAHPWFGVGPEHVGMELERYLPADIHPPLPKGWYGHLHNIYLHYAAERGVPAMLALMWMLGKMLLDFLRRLSKLPPGASDARFMLHGGVAVILATLVSGLFEVNLGDSEYLYLFLASMALVYNASEPETTAAQ